jgi:signal transduction histidine kinase
MPAAPLPPNESERLRDLERYQVLDTAPDAGLDALTQFASQIAETPIALISLTDETRQWFKSRVGLDLTEIPRDWAPCAHAVATGENIVCSDMRLDDRFADNPLVKGPPHLRFYAGMALVTPRGTVLGTLAVIDTVPRTLTVFQQQALALLARQTVDQLELRTAYRELAALRAQEQEFEARLLREKAEEAQRLAAELHDGVGQELVGIAMLVGAALRLAREDGTRLEGPLAEINRLLRASIETCRSTAQEQGGFLISKEGLGGALGRLAQRIEHADGPRLVFEQSETPIDCLDDLTVYHMFRIGSEAIMNAQRHSGAKTVHIRSFHADGILGFEVEDDGVGETGVDASTSGLGKSIMAYRAHSIGAQLEVTERAGGGLRISCRLRCGCGTGVAGERHHAPAG